MLDILPGLVRRLVDMILPGRKDWLESSLAGNWSMLRLESDLLVWSAWSLSDSWAAWTEQFSTERTTTVRRHRADLTSGSTASDTSYSYSALLVLVVFCSVSILLVLLLGISVSCWVAGKRWRKEESQGDMRDQLQSQWSVVDYRNDAASLS
jgi:hypothetical protein